MSAVPRLRAAGLVLIGLTATLVSACGGGGGPYAGAPVAGLPPPKVTGALAGGMSGALLAKATEPRGAPAALPAAQFPQAGKSPVVRTAEQPVSTFSLDVDTASYALVRRLLNDGRLPPVDAVRIEEMVNYFPYAWPAPEARSRPLQVSTALLPTPWNPDTRLLRIGIRGWAPATHERPPANLVFLIDVSGSMDAPDRLGLLQKSLGLLVERLRPEDRVAIVSYAGGVRTVLEPTSGRERTKILAALDGLAAGGSTAGAAGLEQAYRLAREHFDRQAVNRVILGTDGDFNVGLSDPAGLAQYVSEQRKAGVYLSVLTVGLDNLHDGTAQALAQAGNGNAAYLDSVQEGRRVLVEQLAATMIPVADDAKVQVEFNPAEVSEYRLLGYETRALARADFTNDAVDAGDLGVGHTVTALYEITPAGARARIEPGRYEAPAATASNRHPGELAWVKLRWKQPGAARSEALAQPVRAADAFAGIAAADADTRFAVAVAAFGQWLRQDTELRGYGIDAIETLAQGARGEDGEGRRAEFVQLVRQAAALRGAPAR